MKISFIAHGETQIDRELLRYQGAVGDASPVFEIIYKFLLQVEQEQFATEGAQSGHAWPALAESTVKAKQRLELSPEILRATDALLRSLTEEDGPEQMKIITPNSLAFGSYLPYAAMHQQPGPGATYPQRRPIDLTESNKRSIVKSVQLWIARGVTPPVGTASFASNAATTKGLEAGLSEAVASDL